jgi:hypothetical protein
MDDRREGASTMGFHIRGLAIFILLMLPNLLFLLFPPKNVPEGFKPSSPVVEVLEQAGRAACFLLPVLFGRMIAERSISFVPLLMAVCLIAYYACWILYFLNGRAYPDLFKPLGILPIPMAVFPALFLILLGVWVESALFLTPALVFSAAHLWVSWNTYVQIR